MTTVLPNSLSLADKRIVVTGAAGGIGSAIGHRCADLGADLLLLDRDKPESLPNAAGSVDFLACDVTDRQSIAQAARQFPEVDAVITGAGICPFGDWESDPDWDQEFRQVMDVNVLGSLNTVRAWLPAMRARGNGRVVMIGSLGGRNGGESPIVQPHYVASKGGVHALVWHLAKRLAGDGILVNGVAPGPIATAMTATTNYDTDRFPLKRPGTPDEIAWPAAFLCTAGASYFSGTVLDVNGGLYVG